MKCLSVPDIYMHTIDMCNRNIRTLQARLFISDIFIFEKHYIPALGSLQFKKELSLFVYLSLSIGKLFGKTTYKVFKSLRIRSGILFQIANINHTIIFNH